MQAISRPCCSPYHEEDPQNCYHCGYPVRGECFCSDEDIAQRDANQVEFFANAMRCWCGGCEWEEEDEFTSTDHLGQDFPEEIITGGQLHPAPCAMHERNEEWARADRDEEESRRSRLGW